MGTVFHEKPRILPIPSALPPKNKRHKGCKFLSRNGGRKYEKNVWQCAHGASVCIRRNRRNKHDSQRSMVEWDLWRWLLQTTNTASFSVWCERGRERCPTTAELQSSTFTLLPKCTIAGFPRGVHARL